MTAQRDLFGSVVAQPAPKPKKRLGSYPRDPKPARLEPELPVREELVDEYCAAVLEALHAGKAFGNEALRARAWALHARCNEAELAAACERLDGKAGLRTNVTGRRQHG